MHLKTFTRFLDFTKFIFILFHVLQHKCMHGSKYNRCKTIINACMHICMSVASLLISLTHSWRICCLNILYNLLFYPSFPVCTIFEYFQCDYWFTKNIWQVSNTATAYTCISDAILLATPTSEDPYKHSMWTRKTKKRKFLINYRITLSFEMNFVWKLSN